MFESFYFGAVVGLLIYFGGLAIYFLLDKLNRKRKER